MLTAAYPKCTPASHQQRRSASRRRNTVSGTAGSSSHFLFWSSVPSLGPLTFLPAFFPSILGRMDALKKKKERKTLGEGEIAQRFRATLLLQWIWVGFLTHDCLEHCSRLTFPFQILAGPKDALSGTMDFLIPFLKPAPGCDMAEVPVSLTQTVWPFLFSSPHHLLWFTFA